MDGNPHTVCGRGHHIGYRLGFGRNLNVTFDVQLLHIEYFDGALNGTPHLSVNI